MADAAQIMRRLRPLLAPAGMAYGLVMAARRAAYGAGWLASWRPPCPSVSVGNIGFGGSGKTPLCGFLLRWAAQNELPAVVLTRGYGGKPHRLPLLVTPGADPAHSGDEPLMLARTHPHARIVVDPKRKRSGPWAEDRFDPELVLLDDGFQHLGVARDLDLVLLTQADLTEGWGRVCPAGTWREGPSALAAAHAFFLKVTPDMPGGPSGLLEQAKRRLGGLNRPLYTFALKPRGLSRLAAASLEGLLPDLGGEDYVLACGIGDPAQAQATAQRLLGKPAKALIAFADHHPFSQADVERIRTEAGGAHVVVTPKDAVKLTRLEHTGDFLALRPRVRFGPALFSEEPFESWFAARFTELAQKYRSERFPEYTASGLSSGPEHI